MSTTNTSSTEIVFLKRTQFFNLNNRYKIAPLQFLPNWNPHISRHVNFSVGPQRSHHQPHCYDVEHFKTEDLLKQIDLCRQRTKDQKQKQELNYLCNNWTVEDSSLFWSSFAMSIRVVFHSKFLRLLVMDFSYRLKFSWDETRQTVSHGYFWLSKGVISVSMTFVQSHWRTYR